jgi:GNAT superfamily N-acetyltransferase
VLTIKAATVADIPLIRTITMQVWPPTYLPIVGQEQLQYMLDLFYAPEALAKQIEEQGHTFILCYYNNEAVAFAAYSETESAICKLHKLYILPGVQGKGIGRFIIAYILRTLKAQGISILRLNVNIYNAHAIAFYTRVGFIHLKDEDIPIGNGYFMNDHVYEIAF